jgi:hypothetical protein
LLCECIHSFWERKQTQISEFQFDYNKIHELYTTILKTLKLLISDLSKVEEIFTLEAYKLYKKHHETLVLCLHEIHVVGGTSLSYMMANKMLEEVQYVASNPKQPYFDEKDDDLYGKSFDILTLMGCFEKPIGTEEQIQARMNRK